MTQSFEGTVTVKRGLPMPWRWVFKRWMKERPPLERIDFADVERVVGQQGQFKPGYDGPVVRLQRTFSGEVK
jgi:hypothetical protein